MRFSFYVTTYLSADSKLALASVLKRLELPKEQLMYTFAVTNKDLTRHISILLLTYYFFGAFCLPQGDFSTTVDLPKMYQHCKTEDKDMTPFDFIKDHLINIDGVFDKHEDGDDQKPHSPIQFHNQHTQTTIIIQQFKLSFTKPIAFKNNFPIYTECFYFSDYASSVFRPPIV